MDLVKVLKIEGVTVCGDSAFGQYSAPEWLAPGLDSLIDENSPTGQFIRGLVLGAAAATGQDIDAVNTIYLQPINYMLPSLTIMLTPDHEGFGSGFGCGVGGGFTPSTFDRAGTSRSWGASWGNTMRSAVDPIRENLRERGRREAAADPSAFFAKYFTKLRVIDV